MLIDIPSSKLAAIQKIAQTKQALRKQLEDAMVTIEYIKSQMSDLPSAKELAIENGIPLNTVRQILATRTYKIGQSMPKKFRSTNHELAQRNAARDIA
jgi:uncharacterized membrane protein